jgi:hypothetical protein
MVNMFFDNFGNGSSLVSKQYKLKAVCHGTDLVDTLKLEPCKCRFIQLSKKVITPLSTFRRSEKLFCRGVRECATEKKTVIFQRVAEFISATRFPKARIGRQLLTLLTKKPAKRFFDSLKLFQR